MNRTLDGRIAVIGTGTMGSMALWRLSQHTDDLVAFDSHHAAHDRSAVGGDTRLFRVAYQEGAVYAPLLDLSERMFHELNANGVNALNQWGGLSIGSANGQYIAELLASVRATGVEHEILDHAQLSRRYPQHALLDDDIAVFDPRGGVIRTDEAVLGATGLATANGATVVSGCSVQEIIHHADAVEVVSDNGTQFFEQVVVTSGAWSTPLLPDYLAEALMPRRVPLTWFVARNPAEFSPEAFPIFVRESGGVHMFGAPSVDAASVKISGMASETGSIDPSDLDRSLSRDEMASANDAVARFFPGLIPSCVRADTYPDLYTPDMRPIIGRLPGAPRIYAATGFSGRGFKMAAGVGEVIARDLLTGSPGMDLDFASPDRFVTASVS